jgi:hypothetical protein
MSRAAEKVNNNVDNERNSIRLTWRVYWCSPEKAVFIHTTEVIVKSLLAFKQFWFRVIVNFIKLHTNTTVIFVSFVKCHAVWTTEQFEFAQLRGFNVIRLLRLLLSGSTALERTLAVSHSGGFLILFRHLVGLLWTSDKPVAKASTYTDEDKHPCFRWDSNPRSCRPCGQCLRVRPWGHWERPRYRSRLHLALHFR